MTLPYLLYYRTYINREGVAKRRIAMVALLCLLTYLYTSVLSVQLVEGTGTVSYFLI
jgi:hypothetical protein